jgi:GntR family transcriptional regulator/MocR family aminotransferase
VLDYPDPRGLPPLRAALADYLARARGVTADPGHIVICPGFGAALAAICRVLRSAGAATLAVEAYGHQAHRDIAAARGLRLRPVPVDRRGAVVSDAGGADALLLTPAHQFPLGVSLHPQRRREAAQHGGLVIEDDYDGEFRYDRQPVGALQALAPDRVIYAGTASKSLVPGLRPHPVPVDRQGAVVADAGGADALLLTPAHQFPLGMTLQPQRRRQATQHGGLVIEDDYDGEFRYDRQPVGALQALAPDRVIYAGTASKSLVPGLRLGWLVVPPRLLDAVTAELGGGPPAPDQLTLAEFITSGGYDRQIRRARLAYRRRRDRLAAALRRQGRQVGGIAAGLHAVLELGGPDIEDRVIARAAEHGLAIEGLSRYRAGPGAADLAGLVIGYGRPPEHAYTTALARLCAVLDELLPIPFLGVTH